MTLICNAYGLGVIIQMAVLQNRIVQGSNAYWIGTGIAGTCGVYEAKKITITITIERREVASESAPSNAFSFGPTGPSTYLAFVIHRPSFGPKRLPGPLLHGW